MIHIILILYTTIQISLLTLKDVHLAFKLLQLCQGIDSAILGNSSLLVESMLDVSVDITVCVCECVAIRIVPIVYLDFYLFDVSIE